MLDPLPIDPFIDEIVAGVRRSRALVVTAQPGAGKTTRVPPALLDEGPLVLLQPRRVAARAIARRIAEERSWTLGDEIGWHIRFERRVGPRTTLLVATEGVLTGRLQHNPLLSEFRTIVLDEFHERSIHADLALTLAKQAWRAREDLRIVVMSATMDAAAVSAFLDGCPVVNVPGRTYPLDISYAPGQSVPHAVMEMLNASSGHVLAFLPGAFEIRRAIGELEARGAEPSVEIIPLYGSLDAARQDVALRPSAPSAPRRIVVATNVAETSVTVPGVTAVVDSGLHKLARYDADRGIDSLEVERITADAADQRAGRAGRVAPGVVRRLWDARDRLRPHREPEIHRIDLSGPVLDILAWGGDPRRLDWFERPRDESLNRALALLERLGAVHDGKLTDIGQKMRRLPLHPRLARMLVAANGAPAMAQACALLSERHFFAPRKASTSCDLLSAVDDWQGVPFHVQRVARDLEQMYVASGARVASGFSRTDSIAHALSDADFRKAVLSGYPDRVAQRREHRSPRVRLASGTGAVVAPESGVTEGDFLVALDVQATSFRGPGPPGAGTAGAGDAKIRVASRVEREWLEPTTADVVHRFDRESGRVQAAIVERYDALVLAERPAKLDPEVAVRLLTDAWKERGPLDSEEQLLRRLRFAGHAVEVDDVVRAAAEGAQTLHDVRLDRGLSGAVLRELERDAPEMLKVPSGRTVRLEYGADQTVSASVKLQELFGLAETPRIGKRKEPLVLALLAPNGRPVQLTRDLRSFWDRTYPEVRKELRSRYPKHPWPEDPWNATPTARVKRSSRK